MQVIDDYVRESPALTTVAKEWVSMATVACDRTLNLLSSAHSMSDVKQKAKVNQ